MPKKHLVLGILAHVDAGKTTLSESLLYLSGSIRKLGRVDHQSAFLDTHELERARGITIFSKQARFSYENLDITLLDTPGHVDFSAEMERTLQVLDYAILVISGADGVQGHTETLWRLLGEYHIPTFIFVNKMDQEGIDHATLLQELQERLGGNCISFSSAEEDYTFAINSLSEIHHQDLLKKLTEEVRESLAMCSDELMHEYLETGTMTAETVTNAIAHRQLFPCFFGSALKVEGVQELLQGLCAYTKDFFISFDEGENEKLTGEPTFGAKVYKIGTDEQGNRLTYIKITSGTLKVKDVIGEEKVNQIRFYSGIKYETVNEVRAGHICAITGLSSSYAGQGLGVERASAPPHLEPVLTYQIILPEGVDVTKFRGQLKQLEEEEPLLHITWHAQLGQLHAHLMGEVQTEILRTLIAERFGVEVTFGEGAILYRETIANTVEGVGHYEPLRHYAEVHLLLEPGERGSGLVLASKCSNDLLDGNWQNLILTHLAEKEHLGVLTGAAITDMKITLVNGRAHIKHTEGGDFRQATYRAVRHGLMQAECILLEPFFQFRLEVPTETIGRAMNDITQMAGTFEPPETHQDNSILTGLAPVATMAGYHNHVLSYTGGRGRLSTTLAGYQPCHNADEVIEEVNYDAEADLENPSSSVFCAHGAGFVVKWDEVPKYMHLEPYLREKRVGKGEQDFSFYVPPTHAHRPIELTKEELDAIYVRTPDPKRVTKKAVTVVAGEAKPQNVKAEAYLLVDGYNIIFAWEGLRELAEINIESARDKLIDILSNYQGYKGCHLILVFDAYKVEGNIGAVIHYGGIDIVYTKEAETADQYIEKTVVSMAKQHQVTVATSDATEQIIIMGQGALRLSAAGLREEIDAMMHEIRMQHMKKHPGDKTYLFDHLDEELAEMLEEMRLGR